MSRKIGSNQTKKTKQKKGDENKAEFDLPMFGLYNENDPTHLRSGGMCFLHTKYYLPILRALQKNMRIIANLLRYQCLISKYMEIKHIQFGKVAVFKP